MPQGDQPPEVSSVPALEDVLSSITPRSGPGWDISASLLAVPVGPNIQSKESLHGIQSPWRKGKSLFHEGNTASFVHPPPRPLSSPVQRPLLGPVHVLPLSQNSSLGHCLVTFPESVRPFWSGVFRSHLACVSVAWIRPSLPHQAGIPEDRVCVPCLLWSSTPAPRPREPWEGLRPAHCENGHGGRGTGSLRLRAFLGEEAAAPGSVPLLLLQNNLCVTTDTASISVLTQ